MYTGINYMTGLTVTNHTIWVAARYSGLYELTFDEQYNITSSTLLVQSVKGSQFYLPYGVTVVQSGIIVTCWGSDYINYLSYNGSELYPPVGGEGYGDGQLSYPIGLSTDGCGTVYVADHYNSRIAVFTGTGRFVTNLGSLWHPLALVFHNNSLYITGGSIKYPELCVVDLT